MIEAHREKDDLAEEDLPPEVLELLHEWFDTGQEENEEALETERLEWEKTVQNLEAGLEQAKHSRDREKQKKVKAQLREAEKKLIAATEILKRQILKGQVELLLENPKALEELRQKWIDAETVKKLDYSVFMATNERGGKDTSGEYIYRKDPIGNILEDKHGNPLVDQDCVKYRAEDQDGIAEQFVRWAAKHKLMFWLET